MIKEFLEAVAPLRQIAKELRIIRELYEAELAQRDTPIIRVTEKPKKDDTEITFTDEVPRPKGIVDRMREAWNESAFEEEDIL